MKITLLGDIFQIHSGASVCQHTLPPFCSREVDSSAEMAVLIGPAPGEPLTKPLPPTRSFSVVSTGVSTGYLLEKGFSIHLGSSMLSFSPSPLFPPFWTLILLSDNPVKSTEPKEVVSQLSVTVLYPSHYHRAGGPKRTRKTNRLWEREKGLRSTKKL